LKLLIVTMRTILQAPTLPISPAELSFRGHWAASKVVNALVLAAGAKVRVRALNRKKENTEALQLESKFDLVE
jgi:hypothetical protein